MPKERTLFPVTLFSLWVMFAQQILISFCQIKWELLFFITIFRKQHFYDFPKLCSLKLRSLKLRTKSPWSSFSTWKNWGHCSHRRCHDLTFQWYWKPHSSIWLTNTFLVLSPLSSLPHTTKPSGKSTPKQGFHMWWKGKRRSLQK